MGSGLTAARCPGMTRVEPSVRTTMLALRGRGEIGAAAAREQLASLVEYLSLGGRELAPETDDLAARREVARHGGAVIVDAQIDGRHAAPGARRYRPIGGDVDKRRAHARVGVAPGGLD